MTSQTTCETALTQYQQEWQCEYVTSRRKTIRLHYGNLTTDQLIR